MPSEYEPRDYVIFRRMSPHLVPGFGPRMLASMAVGLAVGLLVFFLLGIPAREVTRVAMWSDRTEQTEQLEAELAAIKYLEGREANAGDAQGLSIVEEMRARYLPDRSDEEIAELAEAGRKAGITPSTTAAELQGMVSDEVTVKEDAVPFFWRVIFACIPIAAGASLFVEINGATIAGEIMQKAKNRKSTRTYVFRSES